jgi:hypothetical protein
VCAERRRIEAPVIRDLPCSKRLARRRIFCASKAPVIFYYAILAPIRSGKKANGKNLFDKIGILNLKMLPAGLSDKMQIISQNVCCF